MVQKSNDQRRSTRRRMRHRARIDTVDGSQTITCLITDVSQTGARVRTEEAAGLPDDFILRLAAGENPHRICHLVWKAGDQMGVRFEKTVPGSATNEAEESGHKVA